MEKDKIIKILKLDYAGNCKELKVMKNETDTLKNIEERNDRRKQKDKEQIDDLKNKNEVISAKLLDLKEEVREHKNNRKKYDVAFERNRQSDIAWDREKAKIRLQELSANKEMNDFELKNQ